MSEMLSIIVPCYNEEEMLPVYFQEMEKVNLPISREYIFINDGSEDNTLNEIKKLHKKGGSKVRFISFSRNFGKEAGIYAGLKAAKGDLVVLMDVDLQDPPEILPEMYNILTKDNTYDCVGTRRVDRKGEPFIRSFFAKMFYRIINKISETEIVDGARDYRMMTRKMADAVLDITEYNRFSKGIFSWVGFETKYIDFDNRKRKHGETTWSFWGLLKYSIEGIISYSTFPLTLVSILGVLIFILSFIMAVIFSIRTIIFNNPVQGWTSLTVIILGLGGIQLFALGTIGQYLGKTFIETKNRPIFIIKETEDDIINL